MDAIYALLAFVLAYAGWLWLANRPPKDDQ